MFGDRNTEDPFASIDKADAQGGRNPYLLPGQYLLKVLKLRTFTSRDAILYFIAEFEVVQSDNLERSAGMQVSWMAKMRSDMGPINVKRLLAALSGLDPTTPEANTEITADVARFATSDEQPLTGVEVYAQAQTIQKKIDKEDFTDVKWIPVTPQAA